MIKYFFPPFTEENISSQYKTLAKKFHPDKGGTEKEMKELNEEKEALIAFAKMQSSKKEKLARSVQLVKSRPRMKIKKVTREVRFVFDFNGLVNFIKEIKKL